MSKSALAVFWHPDVLKHDPGRGCYEYAASPLMEIDEPHPETPDRIINIRSILKRGDLKSHIDWRDGRHASHDEIARFHTDTYIDEIILAEASPPTRIDGSGDQAYKKVMEQLVRQTVSEFDPDLIVIACGQDASQFDPNGRNLLSMTGFRDLGKIARELASELCNGRLLLCQEGGYAITYTGFCMYAVAEGVLGVDEPMQDPLAYDATIEKPDVALAEIARIGARWQQLVGA